MAANMNIAGGTDPRNKKMWLKLGLAAIKSIKERTQDGRGVKPNDRGYSFPNYSPRYAELKALGKASKHASDRQTNPPNFRLRNRTMRDLSPRSATQKGVVIGWRNEYATIVKAHMDKKRYQVGGVTIKEQKALLAHINTFLDAQWKRKTNDIVAEVKI